MPTLTLDGLDLAALLCSRVFGADPAPLQYGGHLRVLWCLGGWEGDTWHVWVVGSGGRVDGREWVGWGGGFSRAGCVPLPFSLVALATAVSGHAIFQKLSVDGQDQGQLKGIRAPYSNSPIEDINHADFACNANIQLKDNNVITIPAGARVGAWWQHEIGGPSGSNDPDNPIAASHKGMS